MYEQDSREVLANLSSDEELGRSASRLSLDETVATMGFVVGKVAQATRQWAFRSPSGSYPGQCR